MVDLFVHESRLAAANWNGNCFTGGCELPDEMGSDYMLFTLPCMHKGKCVTIAVGQWCHLRRSSPLSSIQQWSTAATQEPLPLTIRNSPLDGLCHRIPLRDLRVRHPSGPWRARHQFVSPWTALGTERKRAASEELRAPWHRLEQGKEIKTKMGSFVKTTRALFVGMFAAGTMSLTINS